MKEQLELWEKKAVGIVRRYDSGPALNALNDFIQKTRAWAMKTGYEMGLDMAKDSLKSSYSPHIVMGKNFGVDDNLKNRVILKYGQKLVNMGEGLMDNVPYYPEGSVVAQAVFQQKIKFDPKLQTELYNLCGCEIDLNKAMDSMRKEIEQQKNDFSDELWRKEIMPHILRTTYQETLNGVFHSVLERQRDSIDFYSQAMMQQTMSNVAEKLGELFYDYSRKIANETEFLEAPLPMLPSQIEPMPSELLTVDQEEKYRQITQHSLLDNAQQFNQMMRAALDPLPSITPEQARNAVMYNLTCPTFGGVPYAPGKNPEEDTLRFTRAALTVRDLKNAYESRSIFGRWLTPSGWRQRHAIQELSQQLQGFGRSEREYPCRCGGDPEGSRIPNAAAQF